MRTYTELELSMNAVERIAVATCGKSNFWRPRHRRDVVAASRVCSMASVGSVLHAIFRRIT